jgi:Tos1-like cell wall protein
MPPVSGGGLGAAQFATGELDPASNGGTITFEDIGAAGFYRSRRDPTTGPCDAVNTAACCMTKLTIPGDDLTPWDGDLIMSLRGPLVLKQFATYEPAASAGSWELVSAWDSRSPTASQGIAFDQTFNGSVGSVCVINASTDRVFPCGNGSVPYCTTPDADHYYGWSGPKLFVMLMTMPHQSVVPAVTTCGATTNGWYDAPWIGLSLGELIREGAFSSCNCYSTTNPNAGDGCGQFNAFEVVNDDNAYTNLDVFSTNFFGYGGYVGEGPCGPQCNVSKLAANVDLITKSTDTAATIGAIATQGVPPAAGTGPGAALRRPELGYRYFIMLFDVASRTVQLGIVHPQNIPTALAPLLPSLPASVPQAAIDSLVQLRLPM